MNYNESIIYKGYTITKRKSICDDIHAYYAIRKNGKFLIAVNTLQIAKINIDERERK